MRLRWRTWTARRRCARQLHRAHRVRTCTKSCDECRSTPMGAHTTHNNIQHTTCKVPRAQYTIPDTKPTRSLQHATCYRYNIQRQWFQTLVQRCARVRPATLSIDMQARRRRPCEPVGALAAQPAAAERRACAGVIASYCAAAVVRACGHRWSADTPHLIRRCI